MKKLKRALALLVALALALGTLYIPALAAGVVDSGTCGANLTWTLDDAGTLTISGTGAMKDYGYDESSKEFYDTPWDGSEIKSVIIQEGVTSIGKMAFYDCSSLTGVEIPDSVISIGDYAFSFCASLTNVTIGNNVTSIGNEAFANCVKLTSVDIPDSVTSIGDYAFTWCSLTSVTIPDSVTSIGDGAFAYCDGLTSVEIPNSITSIGDSVFDCTALTSVTIPDSVTSIGTCAFRYCGSLTSVVIPANVASIGFGAFSGCSGLTNVYFEGNAPTIKEDCFYSVRATAYYPAGYPTWTDDMKRNYGGTITWVEWGSDGETAESDDDFFIIGRDSNSFMHEANSFGYKAKRDNDGNIVYDKNGKLIYDECVFYNDDSIGFVYPTSIDYYVKLCTGMTWKEEIALLDTMSSGSWDGSCQGLAISIAMANMGKLDVSDSKFSHNCDNEYNGILCYTSLLAPCNNLNLRDLINYYQLLQYTDLMPETKSLYNNMFVTIVDLILGSSGTTWADFWQSFYNDVKTATDNNVPLLLSFGYKSGDNAEQGIKGTDAGHAVITCGYDDSNSDYMIIKLYDCNYSPTYGYLYLFVSRTNKTVEFKYLEGNDYRLLYEAAGTSKDGSLIYSDTPVYTSTKNWNYFRYWDMSAMNSVDTDIGNSTEGGISLLALQTDQADKGVTVFQADAYQKFKLENSSGQYIMFDGESYSSNMAVYDFQILGEKEQLAKFVIDEDDILTITEFEDGCKFSACIGEEYFTAMAQGADTIYLSKGNGIQIEGTEYLFSGALSVQESNSLIYISGYCTENSAINYTNNGIKATTSGEYSFVEIKTINAKDITTNEINSTFSTVELDDNGKVKTINESATPDVPTEPDTPNVPSEPDTPDVPDEPSTPDIPAEPIIPDVPTEPDTPDIPAEPIIPDVPTEPDTPDVPDEPVTPDVPAEPVTPDVPTEPDTPNVPAEPDTPDVPDEPSTPDVPDEPTTPDTPEQAVTPQQPSESTEQGGTKVTDVTTEPEAASRSEDKQSPAETETSTAKSPKTGDNMSAALWAIALGVSAIGAGAVLVCKRKA